MAGEGLFVENHSGNTIAERIDASGDCWVWTGPTINTGYGVVAFDGRTELAHRLVYEMLVGPILDGFEIDHLCRNILCCNPDHLEPVTRKENVRRGYNAYTNKTHCPHGHPYSGDNLYISPGTLGRRCRVCIKIYNSRRVNA